MKKFPKYKQGFFTPINNEKYHGTSPIVFRSSWEFSLMRYLDNKQSCTSWSSESSVVRYLSPVDNREHRYFIDFKAVFKTSSGEIKIYYIEVKPFAKTIKPIRKRQSEFTWRNQVKDWLINQAKWKSATEFANRKMAKFIILTEKDLFLNNA